MQDPLKHLRQYQTGGTDAAMEIVVPLPRSASGFVERHCPNEACAPRIFQMGEGPGAEQQLTEEAAALTRRRPGGDGTVCPYCGVMAEDAAFVSARDREAALEHAKWAAMEGLRETFGASLRDLARTINRGNRGGMISITAQYTASPPVPSPQAYREDLLRLLTCNVCARGYGVYAVGLFCPDCGATNVNAHFARELQIVRDQAALSRCAADDGHAELAYRLLGNAHEDVVTAFETYLKTLFRYIVRRRQTADADELLPKRAIGNAFQNIKKAHKRYAALGIDLFAGRTGDEMALLERNIQKRHVIGHNLGLVDEAYADQVGESGFGHSVELTPTEVTSFAEACAAVVSHVTAVAPELRPDAPTDSRQVA